MDPMIINKSRILLVENFDSRKAKSKGMGFGE